MKQYLLFSLYQEIKAKQNKKEVLPYFHRTHYNYVSTLNKILFTISPHPNLQEVISNNERKRKKDGIPHPHKFPITHKTQRHLIPFYKICFYFNLLHKSLVALKGNSILILPLGNIFFNSPFFSPSEWS